MHFKKGICLLCISRRQFVHYAYHVRNCLLCISRYLYNLNQPALAVEKVYCFQPYKSNCLHKMNSSYLQLFSYSKINGLIILQFVLNFVS